MKRAVIALILALSILPDPTAAAPPPQSSPASAEDREAGRSGGSAPAAEPIEMELTRGASRRFDVRALPALRPVPRELPGVAPPDPTPVEIDGSRADLPPADASAPPQANAAAPPPNVVFEGLDRELWGSGSPPDPAGDVGPQYYIQAVNSSVGIFDKAGAQQAAFTFDTLMSQGNFGNLCDTANAADPVVLYDTFEDRWVLTDVAYETDGGGNAMAPAFQCFAVSQTGNPLTGGWHFYSIQLNDFLNDSPRLGVWRDGIYMGANMMSFGPGATFSRARAWALNKQQMYAGSPAVQVVAFDVPGTDSSVIPSNARLQTGTPPPGRPNLFLSTWLFTNAVTVYQFRADWDHLSLSTFTGPDTPIAASSWPNASLADAPQPGTANLLDVVQIRAMAQNQYTNFGGTESLWAPHTVRRANPSGNAAPRWYQVDVTGGNVSPTIAQAATWDPDGANVMHRFLPSLALDRDGNLAMGYSISNGTTMFPSIAYAGRLAGDPANTFSQTETMMFTGTASQTTSTGWGESSSMSLDPDGCTFWYTNQYANPADQTAAKRWKTKVGSFAYPSCTPVGPGGTVTGTVTVTPGGAPIGGATVTLGARSTTTNASGVYSFPNVPAGTYPSIRATGPGYSTSSAADIAVGDGGTTVRDFALTVAPASACFTDTTQADFQAGVITSLDVTSAPGDVTLMNVAVDQQNTAGTTTGTGFSTPSWTGQTFIPAVTGLLVRVETTIFCNGCGGTPPNLVLSVRATSGGLPTGADLASTTIAGSSYASGASVTTTATFATPAALTAGTQYALVMRPVSAPTGSGYFWIRSSPSTYAGGQRVISSDSGGSWSADSTRDYNFKTVMAGPYTPASGDVVSGTRDSNPAAGRTAIWSNLSWTGTTPENTTLRFQVAGSNDPNGPFVFVGPDGTAGTFYTTSPGTLGPLFNLRYAKYKAYLATTSSEVTPVLSDVTLCVDNVDCSGVAATITPAPASVCDNSTGNTASGPAGMSSYAWSISNGTITSAANAESITYTAGASGNVQLTLSVISASGCRATGAADVPIDVTPAQATITPGGSTTFCAGGSVTLTSSSAAGNQWYLDGDPIGGATGQTYVATASGSYALIVSNGACSSALSSATAVTVNPLPATPAIAPSGPTTFCAGGSVTLTSSSASGNQWYLDGNPIGGETGQQLVVTASGNYTVTTTDGNSCTSAASAATAVTVNPIPAQPAIAPSGPTTFCAGGSVTLTSSSASGNQWYLDGNPIGGATADQYVATASGIYTVVVTELGCSSAASAATAVTVNPQPATPAITPSGPTTFCTGGNVTLHSSSASGNQWYLNGSPLGGATSPSYVATVAGDYSVVVTASGCSSAPSAVTTVSINAVPGATITAPGSVVSGSTGNAASVPSAGGGATYDWSITNGTITAGTGTANVTFTAGAVGTLTLSVTVTGNGCSESDSANVTVTAAAPSVTVASMNPSSGSSLGGTNVTISGTGFQPGATVIFGGSAATNVVRVDSTTITATTPAHAAGAVDVTVTNTDASSGTLTNGYTYVQQNFDANGDSTIDPSDVFYLINYLFLGGPAPAGTAGPVLSGDANGDGAVGPADIFYAVSYLFAGGPAPHAGTPGGVTTMAIGEPLAGRISLGRATLRNKRWVVPVIATLDRDSAAPQAMSMRVRFEGNASDVTIRRADARTPVFEVSRGAEDSMSYLIAFGEPLVVDAARSAAIAEIELSAAGPVHLSFDPAVTMFVDGTGTRTATVANGTLRMTGTVVGRPSAGPGTPRSQQ